MTLPDQDTSQFDLTPQDWADAREGAALITAKHRAVITARGLRFMAEGAHIRRHRRDGTPLRPKRSR